MTTRTLGAAMVAWTVVIAFGCVQPEDVPSNVKDLRVLGIQLEPPEILASQCVRSLEDPAAQQALAAYAQPLEYTALIQDPAGEGRAIAYTLYACASQADRTCSTVEDRFVLDQGTTQPGELRLTVTPALLGLLEGPQNALLGKVLQQDTYRGLGGIRVPLVLHLRAGEEEIYAQKLMVYSCNFFPQPAGSDAPTMRVNVNPQLPGVLIDGDPWEPDEVPVFEGPGPFTLRAQDFDALEERYVVPSFELEPVQLEESWQIAWHANQGRFTPNESGGADLGGGEPKFHEAEWTPGREAPERDVTFWFVVRDGRGGASWLTRTAHYRP